jgi:hypothetical protein
MGKRRQLGLSPSEHSLEHTALYERSFHHAGWAMRRAQQGDCAGALDSLLTAQEFLASADTELHRAGKKIMTRARDNALTRRDLAQHSLVASCFRK